jgi:aldehyde dehydrogenase (NAD+)
MVIQTYADENEALVLENDTEYGLNAFVQGGDIESVRRFGRSISAGQVYLNCNLESADLGLPFGGFKMSGNGREGGASGFEAFLETKAYVGFAPAQA